MLKDPIRGKVARILNSRELVLNVGIKDGVVLESLFDVLDPKGEDIIDPDTQEILGSLNRPKVRVMVTKVFDRLSLASTYRKHDVNIGGNMPDIRNSFSAMLLPSRIVSKYETLKTTEKTWEDLDEKESYVKTGDPVVEIVSTVGEEVTPH
jgi:hypothetical protein